MIDLKLLRENPEAVRASQRARGEDPALWTGHVSPFTSLPDAGHVMTDASAFTAFTRYTAAPSGVDERSRTFHQRTEVVVADLTANAVLLSPVACRTLFS